MSRTRLAVVTAAVAVAIAAVITVAVVNGGGVSPGSFRTPNLSSIAPSRYGPKIPAHGAYIGAWVRPQLYDQASQIAGVDALQSQLGRRLDIVHVYLTWHGAFPTQSDLAALRQGSMLLLSWTGTDSRAVASGADDSLIRQRAREIKATGKPVFLEWRWEMDRPNLSGVVGSPADFIAAWRHVRAIFAQQHVGNVAWVWCPTAKGFQPGGNAAAYYPGNAEVDWICADAYPGSGPYQPFAGTVQSFLRWASHHPKPVMIGEYGVPRSYPPQQRAQWLRASAQTVQADPQIKAVVYFDADPLGSVASDSFGLAGDTAALREFRVIADSRYFNPSGVRLSG
ncbi:MAG: hypothetical protein ABSA03_16825 [Streptosporangiaceae bacterium]|jgi:hypothetical protein